MKSKLLVALTFTLALAGCKDNSIQISGKLEKPSNGEYLYLEELKANEVEKIDSVMIDAEGQFSFRREIEYPTLYFLKTSDINFLTLLAEPGENIKITANYALLNEPGTVTGSEGTSSIIQYNKALAGTISKLQSLNEIYMQNSDSPDLPGVIRTLDSTAQSYLREINTYTKNYIDRNINSLVSLVALYAQVVPQVNVLNPVNDIEYFVKVDSSLFGLYPGSEPVKALHELVQDLVARVNSETGKNGKAAPGILAPDIALPSPSGEIIKLSSTRGRIVLLDFWAAWCSPCRKENPNLVKAYNTYSSKGFTIYQVSLDKTREEWIRGIETDKLGQWVHVSDLKYWNSVVVPLYNIESIPYNLLLDKEGNVIASNLRGNQLIEKLAEVMQ